MANLSLNDMQYIINEASKMVLNEITVKDAYARFYKDIPTNHYESIISVIQTGGDDFNDGMVLSPESKWALAIYRKNPQQFLEDFYKLRNENGDGYLDIFVRAKERRIISGTEADLNQYKSIAELGHFVNSLDYERIMGRTKGEQSNAINAAADQADFPYEDEVWKVVIPHTYEASCYWGNGTEWCTATRETSKWYYRYTNDGPLYILINKESNDKFQFHFPSGQFMNEEDYEIDDPVLDTIRATEGLENFFKKAEPENFFSLFYQKLCKTPVLYLKCTDEGEYLLNDEGSEIAGPFDSIMGYNYGFNAKVEKDSYYNFINTRGEVILDEWFASVMYNSDSDTFRTTNNGDEYYLFTSKGKKVNEKPMRRIFSPSYGLAAVVDMHGNANYMKMSDGELIIFPEFEYEILKDTLPFMYQRGLVINHHGYTNIVDNEGNFLCDEWYKKIEYFHKSITDNFKCFFSVKNTDGLYNCLDYNGNVMYDKWFVGPVKEWFYLYGKQAPWANVKLEDGEWVRIDAMGNIYHGNKTNESKKMIGNILTEITVKDAYTKYYSDIPSRDYQRIYLMIQGDNDILLPETKWVLGLYKKKSPRLMEDLYKLKNERGDGYLDIFLRAKERRMISGAESDLNRFKSIAELGTYVSSLDVDNILGRTKGEMSNAVHGAKDDIEKLYEDEYWIVLIPKSHEASCYWAKGAHWCTAYRDSDDYFNEYSSEGPLFMNINKINIEKSSQFHFESDQFMDYYDEEIEMPILNNVGKENTALLKFYQSYLPKEQFMGLCADDLQCFSANRYAIRKDDGTYMIDDDFRIVAGPFEWIEEFNNETGFTRVHYEDGRMEVIDENGNNMLGEGCIPTSMGKAGVVFKESGDYYLRKNDGTIHDLSKYGYVETMGACSFLKVAIQKPGGKRFENVLDENLQEIFPWEYCRVGSSFLGKKRFFKIMNYDQRFNIADLNGNLLFDEWYRGISESTHIFNEPVFSLANEYVVNFARVNGEKVYDEDFIDFQFHVYNTRSGVVGICVLKNGQHYKVNKNFTLTPYNPDNFYESKLTPEDVMYIAEQAAKQLIKEIKVVDAAQKYYSDIPANDFMEIVTTIQGSNDNLLPETKWALALYKKKSPRFMEDLYKLKNENGDGYLDIFVRAKERRMISGTQADLNQYKSIAELGRFIGTLNVDDILGRTKGEISNAVHAAKDDIEKLYEDDEWIVLIPKTHEASCYWAKGAEWCTAYRDDDKWFKYYSNNGPLLMNINKLDKEKSVQFHLHYQSFMDYWDQEIEKPVFDNFPGGKKLEEFYKSYLRKPDYISLTCRDLYCNEDYRYEYFINGKGYFMVDENMNIIAGPFDREISDFNGPLAKTYNGSKNVWINFNGDEIFECEYAVFSNENYILGYQNNAYYIYDTRYNETKKLPYKYVETVAGGGAYFIVRKDNGLYNVIYGLYEKELLPEDAVKVKCLSDRLNNHFLVQNEDDRYNIVKDGRYLFDKGYLDIHPMGFKFNIPMFKVRTEDGAWELIDTRQKNVLGLKFIKMEDNYSYAFGYSPTQILTLNNGDKVEIDKDLNIISKTKGMTEGTLTPEDVMYIVEQTAKQLIKEIKVVDAYSAYYKDIPEDIFQQIVTTIQGNNDTLLPNTKWFLGMYRKSPDEAIRFLPNLRQEDGRGLLDTWERCVQRGVINGNQSNLSIYKTLDDWADFTYQIAVDNNVWNRSKGEWSKAVNSAKNDIEKVYEDENWFVIIPKSMDASCYWGNGTEWCTATRNEENNQFEFYSSQGPLYININKQTKEKYQFHFETHSFMNQKDEGIQKPVMENIQGVTEGLCNFYREITKDDSMSNFFLFDYNINDDTDWTWVSGMDEAVAVIKIKDKGYNFFTDSEGVLSDTWFSTVHSPDPEIPFAKVYHNGGYDIFNLKEKHLEFPTIAFDRIDEFNSYEDLELFYAKAYKNDKVTLIFYLMNHNGYMTWLGRWFDWMEDVGDSPYGYLAVKNDEMWGYVNLDGEIIGDYYDGVWDWKNDYCKVENNGKYNFMNEQGDLVSNVWFDECDDYINLQGKVNVEINGETLRFDVNDINEFNEDLWD